MGMAKRKRRGEFFHTDLIIEVLSKLPVHSLLRFKCVSKSWRNLISSEEFVKLHLKRSQEADCGRNVILYSGATALHSFDFHNRNCRATEVHCKDIFKVPKGSKYSSNELIGSSNGLLCFCVKRKFVLYNPATRCRRWIPEVYRLPYDEHVAFTYDCISDDYKILKITKKYSRSPIRKLRSDTFVYSTRANSWKSVEYPSLDLTCSISDEGVVVNNSLHLIDHQNKVTRSFDLYTEKFTLGLSLPQEVSSSSRLAFLKGDWHLLVSCCDVRMWKNKCWMKSFHCSHNEELCQLLSNLRVLMFDYLKDEKQILVGATNNCRNFFWYDMEKKQTSDLRIPGLPEYRTIRTYAKPWVESLVSLKDCRQGAKLKGNARTRGWFSRTGEV